MLLEYLDHFRVVWWKKVFGQRWAKKISLLWNAALTLWLFAVSGRRALVLQTLWPFSRRFEPEGSVNGRNPSETSRWGGGGRKQLCSASTTSKAALVPAAASPVRYPVLETDRCSQGEGRGLWDRFIFSLA